MNSHVFNAQKWANLTLFEQLGNIASEVGRSMKAIGNDDLQALDGAYRRCLDLIDATIDAWSSEDRRRELLRARELFSQAVESKQPDRQLENYFMQYAIAARLHY